MLDSFESPKPAGIHRGVVVMLLMVVVLSVCGVVAVRHKAAQRAAVQKAADVAKAQQEESAAKRIKAERERLEIDITANDAERNAFVQDRTVFKKLPGGNREAKGWKSPEDQKKYDDLNTKGERLRRELATTSGS